MDTHNVSTENTLKHGKQQNNKKKIEKRNAKIIVYFSNQFFIIRLRKIRKTKKKKLRKSYVICKQFFSLNYR